MKRDDSRYGNIKSNVMALGMGNIKWDMMALGMVILNGT